VPAGVTAFKGNGALGAFEKARKKGAAHLVGRTIYRRRGKTHFQLLPLQSAQGVFARAGLHQHRYQGGVVALGHTALKGISTHKSTRHKRENRDGQNGAI